MTYIEPTAEALAAIATDAATIETPIRMINLLKFKPVANYGDIADPAGDDGPSTGAAAYARYGATALQEIGEVGGSLFYAAVADMTFIGPADEQWDQVAIVEYPSRAAFLEMVAKPSYQAAVFHRTAGLADTRIIMTTP